MEPSGRLKTIAFLFTSLSALPFPAYPTLLDVIRAALEGFNGTAFAYGQTSSGKTFTMNGTQNDPGIIQRAVNEIFQKIEMTTSREFLIRVSYMEIYNEDINDLFAVENQKLQIHESLDRGIFVAGLREEIVNDAEQVLELIQRGEAKESIILMMLFVSLLDLNLVDLAGWKARGHIPYRDSKLTRILQPALGGNAKTSIICTVAPEGVHIEESKGTLQFASRAKRITNCVQVNEILNDAALLKRQKREIEELRMKLQGSHSAVLEQEILKLRNDLLTYELEREKLAMELEEEKITERSREQSSLSSRKKSIISVILHLSQTLMGMLHRRKAVTVTVARKMLLVPLVLAIPNAFVAKRSQRSQQAGDTVLCQMPSAISQMKIHG
ncbi:Kinesin-like protein KIN-7N [Datura stramonium]|uniref:Kinesin-like protein KIN-7N n=1 Tax=Datura stramonium TaxID=4076 RepID=A0ABS8VI05_DATST|nr:Kinesin-like protein KIN-7N [Datura stramonium]